MWKGMWKGMLKGCEKECRKERKLKCGNKNSFVKNPFGTIDLFMRIIFCGKQYFTQRFKTRFQEAPTHVTWIKMHNFGCATCDCS